MEEQAIKKNISFGKTLIIFNYVNLVYIFLRITTIILAQGGMVIFSKRSITTLIIIAILDYVFWNKLKKTENKKVGKNLLIFGVISTVIIAFYIFMIVTSYIYPAY